MLFEVTSPIVNFGKSSFLGIYRSKLSWLYKFRNFRKIDFFKLTWFVYSPKPYLSGPLENPEIWCSYRHRFRMSRLTFRTPPRAEARLVAPLMTGNLRCLIYLIKQPCLIHHLILIFSLGDLRSYWVSAESLHQTPSHLP